MRTESERSPPSKYVSTLPSFSTKFWHPFNCLLSFHLHSFAFDHLFVRPFVHSFVRSFFLLIPFQFRSHHLIQTAKFSFIFWVSISVAESHLPQFEKLHFLLILVYDLFPTHPVYVPSPSTPIVFTRSNFLFRSLPIDLIWFIRFTSGFDIPSRREIPFIWPRLTYFQWKIMFKWWKRENPVVFVRR